MYFFASAHTTLSICHSHRERCHYTTYLSTVRICAALSESQRMFCVRWGLPGASVAGGGGEGNGSCRGCLLRSGVFTSRQIWPRVESYEHDIQLGPSRQAGHVVRGAERLWSSLSLFRLSRTRARPSDALRLRRAPATILALRCIINLPGREEHFHLFARLSLSAHLCRDKETDQ